MPSLRDVSSKLESLKTVLEAGLKVQVPEIPAEITQHVPAETTQHVPKDILASMGGHAKADAALDREAREAFGRGLLGQWGELLQAWMPPLYEFLMEHPEMVERVLNWPSVQRILSQAGKIAKDAEGKIAGW